MKEEGLALQCHLPANVPTPTRTGAHTGTHMHILPSYIHPLPCGWQNLISPPCFIMKNPDVSNHTRGKYGSKNQNQNNHTTVETTKSIFSSKEGSR